MISLSQRPSKSGVLFGRKARKSVKREEGPPDHRLLCYVRIDIGAFLIFKNCYYWGRQEEPAILISRLFLPMRRDSHVRSQHLFGLPLRMNVMHGTQFHHARIDHLHVKLTQIIAMEQKRFDLRSLLPTLPNLCLLLVIIIIILAKLTTLTNTVCYH